MTIEELENKHSDIIDVGIGNTEEKLAEYCFNKQKEHTKISIEFAIEVLEEFTTIYCECGIIDDNVAIENKIQELRGLNKKIEIKGFDN